ncbi:cobalt-precorrin-8 methylmutase [Xenorhabdus nematophila]|uniref:Cobalt-precorrin-8X methylmutase (Cobalt-precorrin isomerase) (HBA synthase) n=1 Tax=Xenorhabdus nematophila (strain ATCC 19061 / DSM 3370 / CCUG 14189 / LMG 1036 / NCIMB 9965 / AN6) TaxID=406817 RepID=D3V924_XENNA|nr:cobalt-precorrin-8 methylmutase [Xenorhabdus nematophila]CEE93985.1 Cobalt-precorrin-8X methylmutase (Cobalt-precorrin isomerase) (HBA synthase) [Xenorhabdus nematophila str. Anatoliense]CEF30766.1 Cobalt-precorrin-8X methylmutase (Cobalt-precorrin isomerase) (HBA synthase) [Xenorhabdus nematophila str. Websteri]AYA40821.1 cobalt-precorrin-8 methylmutase [Xenorhabdus nematophila]KHD28622.1 precorrin-8X methylmutase [Xenorhabdus nematophila]MBA0019572.1 cobalt-precorrin-8 methylmutase [Xenor
MNSYIQQPQQIERNSFEIIGHLIGESRPDYRFVDADQEAIIKRVIHTTADFDWLDILWFSPAVLCSVRDGILRGCTLYTDTTMALSGINKTRLAQYGCECRCYVSDPRVVEMAKNQQITRSMAAVDLALQEAGEKIFVFGNAPTALFRLLEHQSAPIAVIGVPVGFVGAEESKNALIDSGLNCIAAKGRKGGSNIAAAIVNAILYRMPEVGNE